MMIFWQCGSYREKTTYNSHIYFFGEFFSESINIKFRVKPCHGQIDTRVGSIESYARDFVQCNSTPCIIEMFTLWNCRLRSITTSARSQHVKVSQVFLLHRTTLLLLFARTPSCLDSLLNYSKLSLGFFALILNGHAINTRATSGQTSWKGTARCGKHEVKLAGKAFKWFHLCFMGGEKLFIFILLDSHCVVCFVGGVWIHTEKWGDLFQLLRFTQFYVIC